MQKQAQATPQPTGRINHDARLLPAPDHQTELTEVKRETDAFLDEIDEVLAETTASESAEAFVSNYRQRGGQ